MDLICKCGSQNLYTETKGTQTGIYCADCGKWLKWATKEDIRVLEHNKPNTVELLQAMRKEMEFEIYIEDGADPVILADFVLKTIDEYIEKAKQS